MRQSIIIVAVLLTACASVEDQQPALYSWGAAPGAGMRSRGWVLKGGE